MKLVPSKLLVFCLLFGWIYQLSAQSITWGPASPPGTAGALEVYSGNATVSYEFTNDAVGLKDVTLQVAMGEGVVYDGGFSFTTSSVANLTVLSALGDQPALFLIDTLAPGEQVTFSFNRKATCDSRTHKIAGGTFGDTLQVLVSGNPVSYSNNSGNSFEAEYDVIYGNIIIGTISHTPSSSAGIGETLTRSYNVTNGSFGSIQEFWVSDSFNIGEVSFGNFLVNGNSIPAGNITSGPGGTRIHFDNTIIPNIDGTGATIGDGDVLFEKDEFFLLTYEVTLLNCNTGNSTPSQILGYYGDNVNEACTPSGSNSTSVSINNGVPELNVTVISSPALEICEKVQHCVRITNTATDPEDFAMDLNVLNGKGSNSTAVATPANNTLSTSIYREWSNFIINDSSIVLANAPSGDVNTPYIGFDFYTTDIDGPGGLEDLDGDGYFDDLGAGNFVHICFDIEVTPADMPCGLGRDQGVEWEHHYFDLNHKNQCGENRTPLRKDLHYGSLLREYIIPTTFAGPSDVNDQDTFQVWIRPFMRNRGSNINCEGVNSTNATNPNVDFTVALALPPGISVHNTNTNLPTSYNPIITTNAAGDTAFYKINRTNTEDERFDFNLKFDCALWDNVSPLVLPFQTTYKCGDCYEDDIHCGEIVIIPHCPGCPFGIATKAFEPRRTTAGYTDNTMTTMVDLDDDTHATDWLLPFDTFEIVSPGVISGAETENVHFRIAYTPDSGNDVIEFVEGEITFYDVDGAFGGNYHTFNFTGTPTINDLGGGNFEALFDFSSYISMVDPAYVLGRGSGGLGTFDRDSVNLNLRFVLNNDFPEQDIQDLSMRGTHFYYDDMGEEVSCDSYGGFLYHEYPGIRFTDSDIVILRGCDFIPIQPLFAIGSATGDPFPNEYRPIYRVDSIIYELPDEFEFTDSLLAIGGMNTTFTHYFNTVGNLVVKTNPDYEVLDTRGTHYPRPQIFVKANCLAESGGPYRFPATGYWTEYLYADPVNHQNNNQRDPDTDLKEYVAPSFTLTPLNQIIQGDNDTISWEVQACNETAALDVDFAWMMVKDAAVGLIIDRIVDISTGTEIPLTTVDFGGGNTLVQLGDLAGATCTTIRIYSLYQSCQDEMLEVDFGWSCASYPTNLLDVIDCMQSTTLEVHDQEATVSATITSLTDSPVDPLNPTSGNFNSTEVAMCEEFPVEVRFISSDAGALYDINFNVLLPNGGTGLEYVLGSGTIEVEGVDAVNAPRVWNRKADTTFANSNANNFKIYLEAIDSTNFKDKQLLGAGQDPTMNEFILRWKMKSTCNLTSGRRLRMRVYANEVCGDPAGGSGEVVKSSNYNLVGAVSPYNTSITTTISPDGTISNCEETKNVALDILLAGGTTGNQDSLYVTLPTGITYDGSFTCTSTDCPSFKEKRLENGQEVLIFYYPNGLTNPRFIFNFNVTSSLNTNCGSQEIEVLSTAVITGLMCDGVACTTTQATTGTGSSTVQINKPLTNLVNYKAVLCPDTSYLNLQGVSLSISDVAVTAGDSIKIDFYCAGTTGKPIGDLLKSVKLDGPIAIDGTVSFDTDFSFAACSLSEGVVGVISNETNCACDTTLLSFATFEFTTAVQLLPRDTTICLGDTIAISAIGKLNSIFTWSPATNSSCTNCTNPSIYPIVNTDYIITEQDTLGCFTRDTLQVVVNDCDWGDLPDVANGTATDDYQTIHSNNGPRHFITNDLRLGINVDGEVNGQPSNNALGDGVDEDGVAIFASMNLSPGSTFRLPLSVINTTGNTAHLEGWVDWNGDGDFLDANEMPIDVDDSSGFPSYLEMTVPLDAQKSSLLGFRIRLSNTDNMTPYGRIDSGEVEDYLLGIDCKQVCLPIDVQLIKE